MGRIELSKEDLPLDADFVGNNAAFSCPLCQKVFIVSAYEHGDRADRHNGERQCPDCEKSKGYIVKNENVWKAWIEWEDVVGESAD